MVLPWLIIYWLLVAVEGPELEELKAVEAVAGLAASARSRVKKCNVEYNMR
jgi:hypothetical protein